MLVHSLVTTEVIHQSERPSTALRLRTGEKAFAYSGDTEWTDALVPIGIRRRPVHLRMLRLRGKMTGHLSWEILKPKIPALRAKR